MVLVDIDGVACDHATAICNSVNQRFGLMTSRADVMEYDHNFGPITFKEAVDAFYRNAGFVMNMGVTPGFNDFVNKLSNHYSIEFATARTNSRDVTRSWLKINVGEYPLHFVAEKRELRPTYVIDDYHLEVLKAANEGSTCFLFKQPWNDNSEIKALIEGYANIHFAESFEDILRFLGV